MEKQMKFDITQWIGSEYFILDGMTVKPEPDLLKWGKWFGSTNRVVAKTVVGESYVSTVFIGLNLNPNGSSPPKLFETMVFGLEDDECERCSTWSEAVQQHERICASMMITNEQEYE